MTTPIIRIHNIETNEVIDREMTDDEFIKYEADQQATRLLQAQAEAKAAQKAALLDRLGITEDEAKLLLA